MIVLQYHTSLPLKQQNQAILHCAGGHVTYSVLDLITSPTLIVLKDVAAHAMSSFSIFSGVLSFPVH